MRKIIRIAVAAIALVFASQGHAGIANYDYVDGNAANLGVGSSADTVILNGDFGAPDLSGSVYQHVWEINLLANAGTSSYKFNFLPAAINTAALYTDAGLTDLVASATGGSDTFSFTAHGLTAGTYFLELTSNITSAYNGQLTAVPLPAAFWMLGAALVGFTALAKRRQTV